MRDLLGLAPRGFDALRPFQLNQTLTAFIVSSKLGNYGHQIIDHKVTLTMAKKPKHASKMTNQELAEATFHPEVLKHAKEHIERLNDEADKKQKKLKKGTI